MEYKEEVYDFLSKQTTINIATTCNTSGKPWMFTAYLSVDKDLNLYFVSAKESEHSRHMQNNSNIAFTSAWHNPDNIFDRKGVQGQGMCTVLSNPKDLAIGLKVHYKYFPDWEEWLNVESISKKLIESRLYRIEPTRIKFWNDELLGEDNGPVDVKI